MEGTSVPHFLAHTEVTMRVSVTVFNSSPENEVREWGRSRGKLVGVRV